MPNIFRHRDTADIMGSWPLSVVPGFTSTILQPDSLTPKATIIGNVAEPSAGYAVGSMSFFLWIDIAGTPTKLQVNFTAGNKTLSQVISEINGTASMPANTARNNNGFLMLQSPNPGEDSYLRLESIATNEAVFALLGLYSETISYGGDIQQTQHIDPVRQVAQSEQLSMAFGETFSSDVVNRMALQLGINIDRAAGFIDQKRVGVKVVEDIPAVSVNEGYQLNTGNPGQGVYMGPVATPSAAQLEPVVQILDQFGNQLTVEMEEDVGTGVATDYVIDVEKNTAGQLTGRTILTTSTHTFAASDPDNNVHVKMVIPSGPGGVLSGKPLKVIEYVSASTVVISDISPLTGVRVDFSGAPPYGPYNGEKLKVHNVRAQVTGFYDTYTPPSTWGSSTRLEQQQNGIAGASGSVTGVDKRSRAVVSGATFLANTKVGDLVVWSGATIDEPYSNNGNYRVKQVVDNETIELVGQDGGPVYLNTNLSGDTLTVYTDGDFARAPYIRLAEPSPANFALGIGGLPAAGSTFKVAYLVEKTMRSAAAAPDFMSDGLENETRTSFETQRALMRLAGPSVTRFDELLHGKFWRSVEDNWASSSLEHHVFGRHSAIKPDSIDMFAQTGIQSSFRGWSADADDLDKWVYWEHMGGTTFDRRIAIKNDGRLALYNESDQANPANPGTGEAQVLFGSNTESNLYNLEMMNYVGGNPFTFLRMNTRDDGRGNRADGQVVMNHDGRVGLNMTKLQADTGYPGEPQTNLHVRARYSSPAIDNVTAGPGIDEFVNISSTRGQILRDGGGATPGDAFTTAMVNRDYVVSGSTSNNGRYRVVSVTPPNTLEVFTLTSPIVDEGPGAAAGGYMEAGEFELLRLEGYASDDQTVAMTYKPKINDEIYAWSEVDHDNPGGAGDWNWNYVISTFGNADSDGTLGEMFWRWVHDAGGTPIELMRLHSGSLELPVGGLLQTNTGVDVQLLGTLGLGLIGNLNDALIPRLTMAARQESLNPAVTQLIQVIPSASRAGMRLYKTGGDSGWDWYLNAQHDGANNYAFDGGSAFTDALAFWYGKGTSGAFQIATRLYTEGTPWIGSGWTARHRWLVPDGIGTINYPEYLIRDGRIRFTNTASPSGSNPASGTAFTNTLVAKNVSKSIAIIEVPPTGAPSLTPESFNVNSIALVGGIPRNIEVTFASSTFQNLGGGTFSFSGVLSECARNIGILTPNTFSPVGAATAVNKMEIAIVDKATGVKQDAGNLGINYPITLVVVGEQI